MNNAVVYYSNTNQSRRIARYFADKLDYEIWDIYDAASLSFDNLVLVFPIHCQSLPNIVKDFLSKTKMENLTLLATYGRMCHGNVLYEIQRKFRHNIVAAAYVPTRHCYLQDEEFDGFQRLEPIIYKIHNPSPIKIPRAYKNPFSDLLRRKRSQLGVKITKTDECNACKKCNQVCKLGAVKDGVTNGKCIRCLKCVYACPQKALKFSLSAPMKVYLKKKKQDELVIYI